MASCTRAASAGPPPGASDSANRIRYYAMGIELRFACHSCAPGVSLVKMYDAWYAKAVSKGHTMHCK